MPNDHHSFFRALCRPTSAVYLMNDLDVARLLCRSASPTTRHKNAPRGDDRQRRGRDGAAVVSSVRQESNSGVVVGAIREITAYFG